MSLPDKCLVDTNVPKTANLAIQPVMKWVHDHRWSLPDSQRVVISKNGDSYNEFPEHAGLSYFDISDRKFVAAANAHPAKPPILQAADSKWWGWKDALEEAGITAYFLCPEYVEAKYPKKSKCKER